MHVCVRVRVHVCAVYVCMCVCVFMALDKFAMTYYIQNKPVLMNLMETTLELSHRSSSYQHQFPDAESAFENLDK